MSTEPPPLKATLDVEEREHYIYIRCTGQFEPESFQELFPKAARAIRKPGRTANIVTDVSAAYLTRPVLALLKQETQKNKPFVRKSAVIGLKGAKGLVFAAFVKMSGRKDMRPFKTVEDAEAWIVQPLPGELEES